MAGPWTDVIKATAPQRVFSTDQARFFRIVPIARLLTVTGRAVLEDEKAVTDSNGQFLLPGIPVELLPGVVVNIELNQNDTRWTGALRELAPSADGLVMTEDLRLDRLATTIGRRSFAVGDFCTIALRKDGTLWAWGDNASGQLGIGTRATTNTPTAVEAAARWVHVAAGDASCLAIRDDGTLWSWGNNHFWQLGDRNQTDHLLPTQVGSTDTWLTVAVGPSHALGIRADGGLWTWGANSQGQLGTGTNTQRNDPVWIRFRRTKRGERWLPELSSLWLSGATAHLHKLGPGDSERGQHRGSSE